MRDSTSTAPQGVLRYLRYLPKVPRYGWSGSGVGGPGATVLFRRDREERKGVVPASQKKNGSIAKQRQRTSSSH